MIMMIDNMTSFRVKTCLRTCQEILYTGNEKSLDLNIWRCYVFKFRKLEADQQSSLINA